jgi:hypothetical protein
MNGDNIFAAGFLVQAIDILGNYAFEAAFLFHFGQYFMGFAGFHRRKRKIFAVEIIELSRILPKGMYIDDIHHPVFPQFGIYAILASKIRDPCFSTDSGSGHCYRIT